MTVNFHEHDTCVLVVVFFFSDTHHRIGYNTVNN